MALGSVALLLRVVMTLDVAASTMPCEFSTETHRALRDRARLRNGLSCPDQHACWELQWEESTHAGLERCGHGCSGYARALVMSQGLDECCVAVALPDDPNRADSVACGLQSEGSLRHGRRALKAGYRSRSSRGRTPLVRALNALLPRQHCQPKDRGSGSVRASAAGPGSCLITRVASCVSVTHRLPPSA